MQLVIPIQNFNINNVFFNNPIPNTVLEGSLFIRILYSDDYITFNGIYLGLRWKANLSSFIDLEQSSYFEKSDNLINIQRLNNDNEIDDMIKEEQDINDLLLIEEQILNKINIQNKNKVFQMPDQIRSIFSNLNKKYKQSINSNNNNKESQKISFIFKCSGVWITDDSYGLTFKFIDNSINHQ